MAERMTEKQAAAIAATLVSRIGARRAVKAAAASVLEKAAAGGRTGWVRPLWQWIRRDGVALPKSFGHGIETMQNATPLRAGLRDRVRSGVAGTADRLGMHDAARRIARPIPPVSGGLGTSVERNTLNVADQLRFARNDFFKPVKGERSLRKWWGDLTGRNLREFGRENGINSLRHGLRAYQRGAESIKSLGRAAKENARLRSGFVDAPTREIVRDIGARGGNFDRAIIEGRIPGVGGASPIALEGLEGAARREAINREYYRRYRQMLRARGQVLGAAGAGAVAYANQTAKQYAQAAQKAQTLPDERGNFVTATSDDANGEFNGANSLLEWLTERANAPRSGASEADFGSGYNIL